uniref:DH domain-containing protein n=1 Tax=Panagrolaimus sp. ES5 TaxID=591445 RepID=A0AC34F992_9BILA
MKHKSEPNSPNFIRKSSSHDEEKLLKLKDQRYTWPLTFRDLRKPMNLLIQGEKDGIDYLRVIIDMYLPEYRKANKNGILPSSLVGKEKEIFGNIEEIYQFHQHFVTELELYKNNPTDVGCAFVNNIQRIRDIYCEYTINKEQNGAIHHEAETVRFFTQILHKFSGNNNKPINSHLDFVYYKEKNFNVNFDSVLMWPVQRLFKYSMLLNELIQFAPYEIKEIKIVKEDIDGITSYANGIVKLADIEDFTVTSDDIFCMADEFVVTEPKRVFKREKEYQVFLFETSILLTKKEKNEKNSMRYVFKDQIMLNDVHLVEHLNDVHLVEHVDNGKNKFGLRKLNVVSSSDNTTIFKAINEKVQLQWIKKLREFTVAIDPNQDPSLSKKSSTTTLANDNYRSSFRSPHSYSSSRPSSSTTDPSSNRNSRSSRDSCEIPHSNGI